MTIKQKNILLILFTSLLWGLNGNMGAYLFDNTNVNPAGFTAMRLFLGGIFLLAATHVFDEDVFEILRTPANITWLAIYGIGGLFVMQFALYACIHYSNAPTGCLLQYCGIFLVILYAAVVMKVPPQKLTKLALVLTIVGVVLLLTKGDFGQLNISKKTMITGILAMLGYTVSNIAPLKLTVRYSTKIVAGWAMVIGGLFMTLICILTKEPLPQLQGFSLIAMCYCIVFGTVVPFSLYLACQKVVGPTIASLLGLTESVFSTIFSIFWLKEAFSASDFLGMILIFSGVVLMTIPEEFWTKKKILRRIRGNQTP